MCNEIHEIKVSKAELSILISALKYLDFEHELNSEEEELLEKLNSFIENKSN